MRWSGRLVRFPDDGKQAGRDEKEVDGRVFTPMIERELHKEQDANGMENCGVCISYLFYTKME
jgi:hypothetical protein